MGGGKQPSGTGPGYEAYQTDWHGVMLMGQLPHTPNNASFFPLTATEGVLGNINDVLSTTLGGTPYADVDIFDPDDTESRFEALTEAVDEYLERIQEDNTDDLFEELYNRRIALETDSQATFPTRIEDIALQESERLSIEAADEIAGINAAASISNSVGHSTRLFAIGKVNRQVHQRIGEITAELYKQNYQAVRSLYIEESIVQMEEINRHDTVRAEAIDSLTKAIDLWSAALRQKSEDDLKLAVEDGLWNLKLYDFGAKALSSISGAAIIPAGTGRENRTLESISTFATAGASIAQAV